MIFQDENSGVLRAALLRQALRRLCFLVIGKLLEATCIPWFVTPPSVSKAPHPELCLCYHTSSPSSCLPRKDPCLPGTRNPLGEAKIISPSQDPGPSHICKVLLPCEATYSDSRNQDTGMFGLDIVPSTAVNLKKEKATYLPQL